MTKAHQIRIEEVIGFAQPVVVVANVTATDSHGVAVGNHRLVVHAGVETFHLGNELMVSVQQQIIDDQPHSNATLGCRDSSFQSEQAAVVRVPEASPNIQRRDCRVHQCQAPVQALQAAIQNVEARMVCVVLSPRRPRDSDILGNPWMVIW